MEHPDDQKILCYCKNVRYGDVRRAIAEGDLKRIEQVTAVNQAGGGCRSCHPEIQVLLNEHRESKGSLLSGLLKKFFTKS